MWAAGGAGAAILAIIGALIRAGMREARHQTAERRHQETLAAIRSRGAAPRSGRQGAPVRRAAASRAVAVPHDELPDAAVAQAAEIVVRTRDATIFALQRGMRVELTTAAWLLEELEQRGIVGAGANLIAPREILVGPEGLEQTLSRLRSGRR